MARNNSSRSFDGHSIEWSHVRGKVTIIVQFRRIVVHGREGTKKNNLSLMMTTTMMMMMMMMMALVDFQVCSIAWLNNNSRCIRPYSEVTVGNVTE